MSIRKLLLGIVSILVISLGYYLFRPPGHIPAPADFNCLDLNDGLYVSWDSLPATFSIYGMGLTYNKHIAETAAEFNPDVPPPIFMKDLSSLVTQVTSVQIPKSSTLINAVSSIDASLENKLTTDFPEIEPLLDYEVELGFILLESISSNDLSNENFKPSLGFFICNDLSSRSLALLGEGEKNRYDYWGISKSFDGFLPVSNQVWIPNSKTFDGIPCIQIETYVNGKLRQSDITSDMIYSPKEMLSFIVDKYPDKQLNKGDLILSGTPGGVAIATPRSLVRLSRLLRFDRFRKLSIKLKGDQSLFLKDGDVVEVRGDGFSPVTVQIEGS